MFAGMANAQLGVNVGYAPQTYTNTYTNGSISNTTNTEMTGIFAGVNYNMPLTGDLCVSLGAQYRMNSNSDEETLLGVTTETKKSQSLIDVPILFNYGLQFSDDLKLSVFLGPTVSYALAGTTKTHTYAGTTTILDTEANWYDDNSNRKALDLSGTIGISLKYHNIRLFGGYNMGLLNLTNADNTTLKGTNIFVGLGYCL